MVAFIGASVCEILDALSVLVDCEMLLIAIHVREKSLLAYGRDLLAILVEFRVIG